MDKTSLNLISIVIGGTGLLVVLTKFNVPELNKAFFGTNPFAIKRDEIESVMTWLFTALALVALLIQAAVLVFDGQVKERVHTTGFYIMLFVGSLVVAGVLVALLTTIGNKLARVRWLPKIVANQMENYTISQFIIEHDGWRKDQLPVKDTLADPERYRAENLQTADRSLEQIEKLLDIVSESTGLPQRLARIKTYFEQ